MSKKPLTRLGLDDDVVKRLASHGVHNVQDIFDWNELHLMLAADLDLRGVRRLLAHVAEQSAPRLRSARALHEQRRTRQSFLPTRLPSVDRALGGGLSRGALTEVVGPAGVGKTQLCLTMAAVAGLREDLGGLGEGTGVLFLDTERKFSPTRLVEIAQRQAPSWFGGGGGSGGGGVGYGLTQDGFGGMHDGFTQGLAAGTLPGGGSARGGRGAGEGKEGEEEDEPDEELVGMRVSDLLQRTHVLELDESSDLMDKLENLETLLIEKKIGLVILDSIAALARKDFQGTSGGGGRREKGSSSSSSSSSGGDGNDFDLPPAKRRHGGEAAMSGTNNNLEGGGKDNNIARTNALVAQAAALKRLADAFNLVVLITNQVTGSVADDEHQGGGSGGDGRRGAFPSLTQQAHTAQLTVISGTSNALAMSSAPGFLAATGGLGEHGFGGAAAVPALGNSWHHCVSTRLVLEHFTTHRQLTITKSPIAAQHTARCALTAAGLVEENDDDDLNGDGDDNDDHNHNGSR